MSAKKQPKTAPTPPSEEVAALLDPEHTDDDFFRDLAKASSDDARRRLGLPSEHAPRSPKTSADR
jgi:hypothetical protein